MLKTSLSPFVYRHTDKRNKDYMISFFAQSVLIHYIVLFSSVIDPFVLPQSHVSYTRLPEEFSASLCVWLLGFISAYVIFSEPYDNLVFGFVSAAWTHSWFRLFRRIFLTIFTPLNFLEERFFFGHFIMHSLSQSVIPYIIFIFLKNYHFGISL